MSEAEYIKDEIPSALIIMVLPNSVSVTYDFLAKSAGRGSDFGVLSVTYDFWPKARRTSLDKIKAVFIVLVKKRRQMQSGTRRL